MVARIVNAAGTRVHLLNLPEAIRTIVDHAQRPNGDVLAVASINLDHLHHDHVGSFGHPMRDEVSDRVVWLNLLDGAPVTLAARIAAKRGWPRLAGSDLIEPVLDAASEADLRVAFLGGTDEVQEPLRASIRERWPGLALAGTWAPSRAQLNDPELSRELAAEIRAAGADIIVVCLGKPRQERWISEHGQESGASVCLAFGAVVDFIAGNARRAPKTVRRYGLEWAWRLIQEPRRLARRYLVQAPPALGRLLWATRVERSTDRAIQAVERSQRRAELSRAGRPKG